MLMLMQCKCNYASLTPRVLQYPLGMLMRTLRLRNLLEPKHAKASAQGSGASPSLRLLISREPMLGSWFLPGL